MPATSAFDRTQPTGAGVTIREQLEQGFTMIEPTKTPFISMIQDMGRTGDYRFDWNLDKLEAPDSSAVNLNQDVTDFADKFANLSRASNLTQGFRETYKLETDAEHSEHAGDVSFARAASKASTELKRNIEKAFLGTQDLSDNAGDSVTRGLGDWIDSAGPTGDGTYGLPAAYRTPAGSIHSSGALTESVFRGLIQSIAEESGDTVNLTLITGYGLRTHLSETLMLNLAGGADYSYRNVNISGQDRAVTLTVDRYTSDFGTVNLVNGNPLCMPSTNTGYLVMPQYLGYKTKVPLTVKELEDQGGGRRGLIQTSRGLCFKTGLAAGKITAIA